MARLIGKDETTANVAMSSQKRFYRKTLKNFGRKAQFSPSDLSSLHAWYKSSTLSLSDGDDVSTWSDSSGNGLDATESSSPPTYNTSNTLNGYNSIYFNGSSNGNQLVIDISGNTLNNRSTTVFAIFKPHATTSTNSYFLTSIMDGGTQGTRTFYVRVSWPAGASKNMAYSPGINMAVGNGTYVSSKSLYVPFTLNPSYSWSTSSSMNLDPSVGIIGATAVDGPQTQDEYLGSINGMRGAIATNNTQNYGQDLVELRIGAALGSSHSRFKGYLFELIICDGSIIGNDHDKVVGYLAHKYGAVDNLIDGHAYKLGPP